MIKNWIFFLINDFLKIEFHIGNGPIQTIFNRACIWVKAYKGVVFKIILNIYKCHIIYVRNKMWVYFKSLLVLPTSTYA